jgi:predicted class III extradiol MEMO1 family dioxygenase
VDRALLETFIQSSQGYQVITADFGHFNNSSWLTYGYEAIIRITEEFEDVLTALDALKEDKSIIYSMDDIDSLAMTQELFLSIAKMCGGQFAHDTLCQYLHDVGFRKCQMFIAHHYPQFFKIVSDKGALHDEVRSYFRIVE